MKEKFEGAVNWVKANPVKVAIGVTAVAVITVAVVAVVNNGFELPQLGGVEEFSEVAEAALE